MAGKLPRLSRKAWAYVVVWSSIITLCMVIVAAIAATASMLFVSGHIDPPLVATAIVLPAIIAPPFLVSLLAYQHRLRQSNAELQELAYRDAMLGCMNRRGFTASLDIALEYASPHRPCALLVIDADNFKQVNDRFGHDRGDSALQAIADAIKTAIRASDVLGRIGGEEFGVFLPGASETTAWALAERIRETVAATRFAPEGEAYQLSVSIGGAVATRPTPFSDLYRAADQRLYAAKQDGRNRSAFSQPQADAPAQFPVRPEASAVA